MNKALEDKLIKFARRLPVQDDIENLERLRHADKFGHIIILRVAGDILGYAECYRMKEVPKYPVIPYPIDDVDGKILYCFAMVCERGFCKDLIKLGFDTFINVETIAYHRNKHGNKLYKIARKNNV